MDDDVIACFLTDRFPQGRFYKWLMRAIAQGHEGTAERKELPIYALTADKSGAKLTPHEAKNAGDPWIDQTQAQFLHCPLEYFASRLGQMMELPPNIPETAQINGAPIDTSGPTIYEALRQKLGLKLERQKGPAPILVIDHPETRSRGIRRAMKRRIWHAAILTSGNWLRLSSAC